MDLIDMGLSYDRLNLTLVLDLAKELNFQYFYYLTNYFYQFCNCYVIIYH